MADREKDLAKMLDSLVTKGVIPADDAEMMRSHLDDPEVEQAITFMGALMMGQTGELVMVYEETGRTETITTEGLGNGQSVLAISSSDGRLSDNLAAFAASQVPVEDYVPTEFEKGN